jgi:hypothetical protein
MLTLAGVGEVGVPESSVSFLKKSQPDVAMKASDRTSGVIRWLRMIRLSARAAARFRRVVPQFGFDQQ